MNTLSWMVVAGSVGIGCFSCAGAGWTAEGATAQVSQAATVSDAAQGARSADNGSLGPMEKLQGEQPHAAVTSAITEAQPETAFGMPLSQVRQIIEAARQSDPEVAQEIERQLALLEHPQPNETEPTPRLSGTHAAAMRTLSSTLTTPQADAVLPIEAPLTPAPLTVPTQDAAPTAASQPSTSTDTETLSPPHLEAPPAEMGRE